VKDPSWRFSYSEVGSHLSRMTPTLSATGELFSSACDPPPLLTVNSPLRR